MQRQLIPGNWRADGSRPFLHRAVVFVTGQGDELATPFAGCTGGCHQGRGACDCDTELACDVAPDADRVIAPPPPLPEDVRSRLKRRALFLSALGFGALAGLLEAFGAQPFDRIVP
jgi:hypothetical protein